MKQNKHKRENLCSFLVNFLQKQKEKQKVLYLPFIEDEDLEDDADEDDFEPGMAMSTLLGFVPEINDTEMDKHLLASTFCLFV